VHDALEQFVVSDVREVDVAVNVEVWVVDRDLRPPGRTSKSISACTAARCASRRVREESKKRR